MNGVWIVLLIGVVGWFWFEGLRSREIATRISAEACQYMGAQLLDGTVALQGWKLTRAPTGSMKIQRRYRFEFATGDDQRYHGTIDMLGTSLKHLDLDAANQPVSIDKPSNPDCE